MWGAKRRRDAKANHAREERQHIAFQVHPCPAAEPVEHLLPALLILDSRPLAEYKRVSIPGGIDCPGAELAYRVHELAPSPETLVSKFPSLEEIHIMVAGGTAGRFSMAVPGWLGTRNGTRPLTRLIQSD